LVFQPPYEVEVEEGEMVSLEGGARHRGFYQICGLICGLFAPTRVYVVGPAPPVQTGRVRPALSAAGECLASYAAFALILGTVVFVGWLLCRLFAD
jgi:hypothetical protein